MVVMRRTNMESKDKALESGDIVRPVVIVEHEQFVGPPGRVYMELPDRFLLIALAEDGIDCTTGWFSRYTLLEYE